ncbi:hypothetical protein K461DRAFT_314816 [Myriangium duriaei CBS 260.36]|uniref:RRM domain-containing protein n=1 Tax=Myriangium duriaei CBS 260.36 TaxID=1168546 RepID=A0A9P4MFB5_9PEZI|nr:hypothetical protein K461DRAFT_314816 [Myriangium duriaei CBS 260.36]
MSPSQPPEDPEFTSEPNVLSPVSPKPMHIPVPSNIPLLQNQSSAHFDQMEGTEDAALKAQSAEPTETEVAGTQDQPDMNGNTTTTEVLDPTLVQQPALDLQSSTLENIPNHAPQSNIVDQASNDQPVLQSIPSGPDYQALLNSLASPSAATVQDPAPSSVPLHDTLPAQSLPAAGGTNGTGAAALPPRPPPQTEPSIHPNYAQTSDIRQFHPQGANIAAPGSSLKQGANGLPPPPVASFQSGPPPTSPSQASFGGQFPGSKDSRQKQDDAALDDESRWGQEIQKEFDSFLEQERQFVTEGNWEQFPYGSRLFVGNLSSERVTKRDVFHVFHKYGALAQISIKQAYGFVQFLSEVDCSRAMTAEQGRIIRGKRINLEISKPQKNRAGAGGGGGGGGGAGAGGRRRSRSPERARDGVDRYTSGGQRRGRDDYRPNRSPSPRGHRDRSRDRHARYRSRSRSPRGRRDRYRSPSPERDDDLPLPRRAPRDVPDVQIIAVDNLDREFIQWVERGISARGIKVDVLILSPRLSEAAVIKRQILEGVTAVSLLTLANQQRAKIPLRVFDRRGGADVRFEEYADLDPTIAAEVVVRAKKNNQPSYGYGYGGGSNAQPSQPAYPPQGMNPNLGNAINSMDANGLQKLLGAMQQPGQPSPTSIPDLAKLLSGGPAGLPHGAFNQPPPGQDPLAALRNNPALAGLLGGQTVGAPPGHAAPQHQQSQQQQRPGGHGQPDMADILAKLGNYRR